MRPPARRECPTPARARASPAPRTPARPASTGRSAAPAHRRRQTPRTGRPGRARERLLLKRLASSSRASLPIRKRRQPRPAARHRGLSYFLLLSWRIAVCPRFARVVSRHRGLPPVCPGCLAGPRPSPAARWPGPGGTAARSRRHGGPGGTAGPAARRARRHGGPAARRPGGTAARRHGGPAHDHVDSASYLMRNPHDHEKSFRFCRARALAPHLSPRTALTVTADHLSHGVALGGT